MKHYSIDINCDVGEGVVNEADLFPYISSCSIACGGHAGDYDSMKAVVALAKKHHVKIGAHPSYPDKANFGRVSLAISPSLLQESIQKQIADLLLICKDEAIALQHIKPHGALYNDIAKDEKLANVFLEAIEIYKTRLKLYVPPGSVVAHRAVEMGFQIVLEAFADRNYGDDLSLVSRKETNALITDPIDVLRHVVILIKEKCVLTSSGRKTPIVAETFCVHGDTSSAFQILAYLSKELPNHKIFLAK
jgi:UPF0271 protein